ncbi:unnamed protein product [Gongylonema pulchrum]|uniref:RRM domain-containing protein n=1 Tax=Gongylonema pulchrum TaxID=637853 RepID=A0A3P7PAE0_9BILA|nr:unnamed protein product [Gongylonema pulchrum]
MKLEHVSAIDSEDEDSRYGGRSGAPCSDLPSRGSSVVRLSGLPYACTKEEIVRFFEPLEIADNGIVLLYDRYSGKPKGEAFVAFNESEHATKALAKNKEYIQHRYVDIYASSYGEMMRALEDDREPYGGGGGGGGGGRGWDRDRRPRGMPYDRPGDRGYRDSRMHRSDAWADRYGGGGDGYDDGYGGRGGGPMRRGWRDEPPHRGYSPPRRRYMTPPPDYSIRMRGLPYRATERDIVDFFRPIRPTSIDIIYEYGTDRPSGEAVVEFRSRGDFEAAMQRNREYMGM